MASGARKAPWFDDVCRRKRSDFLRSLRDGREDLQDTKKEYRKHTRRVALKSLKQQTAIFLDKLSKRDPAIYDRLKQRRTTCPSPVPKMLGIPTFFHISMLNHLLNLLMH